MAPEIMQLKKYDAKVISLYLNSDYVNLLETYACNSPSSPNLNRLIYGALVQYYINLLLEKPHSTETIKYRYQVT